MSHLEIDYELLIKDLSKIPKNKRNWFDTVLFINEWLQNRNISVKSIDEVIKIIKSIKPKLIPKKEWLSPSVTVREFDVSLYTNVSFNVDKEILEFSEDSVNKVTVIKNSSNIKNLLK